MLFKSDLLKAQDNIKVADKKGEADVFGSFISADKFVDDRTQGKVIGDPFHEIRAAE